MKNIAYKSAYTNGHTDDEHVMFETRRKYQELNKTLNYKWCILLVNIT